MDSGLGVRWPLSPYATALAAGALFATFCITTFWKHRFVKSEEKDPSGRKLGADLDPNKEKDAPRDKPGKEKLEEEEDKTKNFPVLAVRESPGRFSYEHLGLSGQFGAIPRTTPRGRFLENNIFPVLRLRGVERGRKDRQEFNPPSINFSSIYQHPSYFGSEFGLNPGFFFSATPHLHTYFSQFSHQSSIHSTPTPGTSKENDNFDVSIRPEILKNKPITRSALCLALHNQLHKFLNEPFQELRLSDRAIQTADIEEVESPTDFSSNEIDLLRREPKSETSAELRDKNVKVPLSALSLWDSGYGEKVFDETSNVPKGHEVDETVNLEADCSSVSVAEPDFISDINLASDDLNLRKLSDSSKESSDETVIINIESEKQDTSECDILNELSDSTNVESDTNFEIKAMSECEYSNDENNLEEEEIIFLEETNADQDLNRYDFPEKNPDFADISDPHPDSGRESLLSDSTTEFEENLESLYHQPEPTTSPELDLIQVAVPTLSEGGGRRGEFCDENVFRLSNSLLSLKKAETRAETEVDRTPSPEDGPIETEKSSGADDLSGPDLDRIQTDRRVDEEEREKSREAALRETDLSESGGVVGEIGDVTREGSSRDAPALDERGTPRSPRQMDRETGERSVAVESTVTTEATYGANGEATRLSTAVVSRLTLDDWASPESRFEDSVSVKTTVGGGGFDPPSLFEDFVPLRSSEKIRGEASELPPAARNGNGTTKEFKIHTGELPSSPRVDRLKGLICRDEERRARASQFGGGGAAMEGEWDRLLRDVLASVSELERWEQRRQCDVSSDAEDAEEHQRQEEHPSFSSQSDSSFSAMEEEALSPNKGETPTKVKSLRFKLDPDIFDVPSDDSFYDDDEDDSRRSWSNKKQTKYRAFSSLELEDEPVRLVSVHASVVPAQKMVARPVGIDLRVRLTEERQSKRAHVSTSPSQAKRRSPVSDRGWCQELSPVTENVDWRETFTPVAAPESKSVPNGILKTPSPKIEPSPIESPNPFKIENGVTTPVNGVGPVTESKPAEKPKQNGWKPPVEKKPFLILPRKKFEPDPEAIERITGYRSALSKPPLPPPIPSKTNANIILKSRAEQARKQYLDNKNALSSGKGDGMKKFQQFLNQAQNDRARIVTSVPDLAAIERAVTEQWTKERASVSPRESPAREEVKKTVPTSDTVPSSCVTTPDDKWASYVQSCRKHLGRRSQSMSYLETDIDIIPVLDDDDKCQSVCALDEPDEALPDPDDSDLDRSREDLDDSGRAKSEHELRIERSLRSLPVPEWYRRSEKTKTGFLLGSSNKEKRGWAAAKSLASSTSSLASCGLRRPVRSLRSSRENIPWSRSSASPDGPTLSLALAKAFREPYLGWRARTPTSSGVSSSPRASPPSWGATTTDDEANGVSFDGEDAFGRTTSSEEDRRDEPLSLDDTGADAVTVSMDTNDPVKLPGGEDTCDDINNMSMDTCELFDAASVVVPVDEDPSPQADTGDDIDNLSTDTTTTEGRKLDPKLKRYSYSQSIYHSEWDEEEESRGDRKGTKEEDREQSPSSASPDHKVVWIESSFVGSRTTTSIVVLPEKNKAPGSAQNRPASR